VPLPASVRSIGGAEGGFYISAPVIVTVLLIVDGSVAAWAAPQTNRPQRVTPKRRQEILAPPYSPGNGCS
jgi:hypothetical protein